jgi:hypothetical protein
MGFNRRKMEGERAAVTSLIPALSCRSCRPSPPFAELLKLARSSVADELNVSRTRTVIGE